MPSITIWSRLEPRTREFEMARGLQAQLRDPAWMLARQWQLGEFLGDDAGSPISATVRTESIRLTSFQGGVDGAPLAIDETLPLEARVEREQPAPGLGDAVSLGTSFEAFLHEEEEANGIGPHAPHFRAAFPIAVAPPADEVTDAAGRRLRALAAGRVVDGVALARDALPHAGDLPAYGPVASLPAAARPAAARAIDRLLGLWRSLFSVPEGDSSWQPEQFDHAFAVAAEADQGAVVLEAPRFRGGHLDWYTFDAVAGALREGATQKVEVREQAFIPNLVSFRGMPASRWWDFEDGLTDFGRLDAEAVDLAKLVVMEFALVYGDDWFELPLPLAVGSLSHLALLVVTDTFGERTVVPPTGSHVPAGERPWSAFALTGADPARDLLLLTPALGDALDGPVLEDVLFVRDEMAAMAWGIERSLEGPLAEPVDGYELYRARLAANPPPPPRERGPDDPPVEYVLGTDVPDNWIPMVPVRPPDGKLRLRRGILGGPGQRAPRGHILEPGHPFYVADEAVPREGITVTRRWRRARWIDGKTVLWVARRAEIGRGEASSGLAFDLVRDLPAPPPES